MKSSLHRTLGHCCFPTTEPDNQMVIRASQLRTLSIVSSNPSIVRVEDTRQLRALGINFMIVGCWWGCGRHDDSARCTLKHALLRPRAIFNDFDAVAIMLTCLDLSVKLSWLEGVDTLCLPNVTVLKMRTTSTYHSPQSSPVTKLDAPRLKKASLQLCDTRIINFTGSTFAGSVKQLMVSTPCYVMKKMEHDTWIWTWVNFIVYYLRVEEIVLAVHSIQLLSPSQNRVQWCSIKMLSLLMDVGIADLLQGIDMPLLETVRLMYPEWRMKETLYSDKRDEQNATSDEEDERTAVHWHTLRVLVKQLVDHYYHEEFNKLSTHFPHLKIDVCYNSE
jgi:hypothetical protein